MDNYHAEVLIIEKLNIVMSKSMENRFIFGAYANMAFDYFQQSMNAIAERYIKVDKPLGDNNCTAFMDALFSEEVKIPNIEKVFAAKFLWILPLLEKLGYENADSNQVRRGIKECCSKFYKLLTDIRNYHTHYVHNPIQVGSLETNEKGPISFFWGLEAIYDGALNVIKKRFGAEEKDVAHLRRMRASRGQAIPRDETDGFYYKLSTNSKTPAFSPKGYAFFIALFLSKEYGYLFLKKLNGFKRGDDAIYRLTLETFTALSARPPLIYPKSESESTLISKVRSKCEASINLNRSLDILNELSKTPIELFDTLSPADQKKYRDIKMDSEKVNVEEFARSRIRHRSRFEYFALRYLDGLPDCATIGFHTYLGNYHHKMYEKTVIDGATEDRQINFQLAGFCKNIDTDLIVRLKEATQLPIRKIEENQRISVEAFEPYIEEVNPHYIVNNNTIGIKILSNAQDEFPTFNDKGAKMPMPDFWLSKYELPAMVFYSYLKRKTPNHCPKSIVDILRDSVSGHTRHTKTKEDNQTLINRRIQKEILWTDSKLKEITAVNTETKSTFGKKQYKTLKSGVIAKILAQDIIELQPSFENGKDKIAGANYQALQRSLAYYGDSKETLYGIFKKAALIESKNAHPFLSKLFDRRMKANYSSLQSFYQDYLFKRRIYFKKQAEIAADGKVNFSCYPLRKLQRHSEPADVSALPTFLPRGIFDQAIRDALSKTPINYETRKERINNTYLIKRYFQVIENDGMQPFYGEKRAYHFIDKQIAKKRGQEKVAKCYLTLKDRKQWLVESKPAKIEISKANEILEREDRLYRKSYNEVCDNESFLRFTEVQDIVLFLIAKALLPNELISSDKFKLKDIKGVLNTSTNFNVEIVGATKVVIAAKGIKIRDYKKVFAVNQDKKFVNLLKQLFSSPVKIEYKAYLEESRTYEDARISVIKNAQLLESVLIPILPNATKEANGFYKFSSLIEEFRTAYPDCDLQLSPNLIAIRNKFSHNEYPKEDILKSVWNSKELPEDIFIAEKLANYFEREIETFVKKLESKI